MATLASFAVAGSLAVPAVAAPAPIVIAYEGPLTGAQASNGR